VKGLLVLLTLAAGPVGPALPEGASAPAHEEPAFVPPGPALPRGAPVPDAEHAPEAPRPVAPALPPGAPAGRHDVDVVPFLGPAVACLALVALYVRRRRLRAKAP
jgi:hypothetical protein